METKVILTITIPGSTLLTETEAKELDAYEEFTIPVLNERNKREILYIKARKTRNAQQVIKLSDEAYNYMTSNDTPEFYDKFIWNRLSKNQRLRSHLARISESLGGIHFNYEVLDD